MGVSRVMITLTETCAIATFHATGAETKVAGYRLAAGWLPVEVISS